MLQLGTVYQLECLSFGFPIRKEVDGIVERKRRAGILVDLLSRGKGLVMHPVAFLKLLLKDACLSASQV